MRSATPAATPRRGHRTDGNAARRRRPRVGRSPERLRHSAIVAVEADRLTWPGHEFLDTSREPGRWQKAKKVVLEWTEGLSSEVLKQVLFPLARDDLLRWPGVGAAGQAGPGAVRAMNSEPLGT